MLQTFIGMDNIRRSLLLNTANGWTSTKLNKTDSKPPLQTYRLQVGQISWHRASPEAIMQIAVRAQSGTWANLTAWRHPALPGKPSKSKYGAKTPTVSKLTLSKHSPRTPAVSVLETS